MRALHTLYHAVAYYASLVVFAVLAFLLNLFCLGGAWLPATDKRERFFQRRVHAQFALFVRWLQLVRVVPVRYVGFERANFSGGRLVVCNHPSLIDVGWLLARIPEAVCIYKPDVAHNPLFGATARRAGYLASNRGHHLLRLAASKLAAGHTLLVFPEGTRTRGCDLNPLKPGFLVMARMARAPIQLVRITCDSNLLAKGNAWWKLPRLPAHITVSLGPCLPPPGSDIHAAAEEIENWYRRTRPVEPSAQLPLEVARVRVEA
ncbi:MAG TPA: lysophospholipid acyltransferase family protein [Opitutaceae bacterium]|nr:lysophospholipid acyltransferase family protein [Opitutaceae bacterium]